MKINYKTIDIFIKKIFDSYKMYYCIKPKFKWFINLLVYLFNTELCIYIGFDINPWHEAVADYLQQKYYTA